jgi:hypothetical protein
MGFEGARIFLVFQRRLIPPQQRNIANAIAVDAWRIGFFFFEQNISAHISTLSLKFKVPL